MLAMESRVENLRKRAFLGAIPDDFLRVPPPSEEPRLHPMNYPGGPAVNAPQQLPYTYRTGHENVAGRLTVTVNQVHMLCYSTSNSATLLMLYII